MGAAGETNGTDTSSIRPVSSLKNRFENLGVTEPTTPLRSPSRLSQQLSGSFSTRSSLDQPRPNFTNGAQSQGNGIWTDSSNGLLRSRERVGPRPPRPVSMGPASPPTTPAVMIQSPQSPPKPAFPINTSHFSESLRPKLRAAPLSPRPFIANSAMSSSLNDAQDFASIAGKKPKPPPPINRANKPVISTAAASLAPQTPKVEDHSVSPFSTPPDSPRSPDSPRKKAVLPFQPVRNQDQNRRQPLPPPSFQPSNSRSSSRGFDLMDEPDHRPNLPARIPQQGYATTVAPPIRTPKTPTFPDLHQVQSKRRERSPEVQGRSQTQAVQTPTRALPPPRPSEASKSGRKLPAPQTFLPPPKRIAATNGADRRHSLQASPDPLPPDRQPQEVVPQQQIRHTGTDGSDLGAQTQEPTINVSDYPDSTQVNRWPPKCKHGVDHIWTHYNTKLFDVCGSTVCSSGYITKSWSVETGRPKAEHASEDREYKFSSMVFKPGTSHDEEGHIVWLGSNQGEIVEFDLRTERPYKSRPGAHGRNDIIKMHRYQNLIWSLDSDGRLLVWFPGTSGVPSLDVSPNSHRVAKGHTFSIIVREKLWLATGKELRVYDPSNGHERSFHVTSQALSQPGTGEITSGAILPTQLDRVYFGHSDGKVSIYSTSRYTCQAVVNVTTFKITTMAGVGDYIWAGFSNGWMHVYDITTSPWKVRKEWKAHDNPITGLVVDRSSVWKYGHLRVASLGLDNLIRFWDGMLADDWLETRMHEQDLDYCQFREVKVVIATWNAGASTPGDIRHDQRNNNFFREVVQPHDPPEILVFGFQELVDLEDKGLTAKNFFKGRSKKQGYDSDHMGHQYRAWKDYLTRLLSEVMPADQSYTLLQTGSLVGLFSCIFVKSSEKNRIRDLNAAEIKRGMGGLYGNKGAILIRFTLDSTSLCFVNCHLAAGQKELQARNNDATAILESSALGLVRSPERLIDCYTGGGDGTMILDHEICIWNGDLNYRIDTMGRDSVVKTIKAGNLTRLLERDQLGITRRRNAAFRLGVFREQQIMFPPTYKYDVGTDNYDSSEKSRSPAWCDRVLYRGHGRIKGIEYRQHDCRASDHRPVSATFMVRIKDVLPEQRERVWEQVQEEMVAMKMRVADETRTDYLVNVLGVEPEEAKRLLHS